MTDKITIIPISNRITADYREGSETFKVRVPGSKSITNRALLLAMLSGGFTRVENILFSDDSRHFLECVKDLGFEITVDEMNKTAAISGLSGRIPLSSASINVGSAGTAARFLAAVLGVSEGEYHLDSSDQMKKRPMAPLLSALETLGCEISYEAETGHFPFTLKSHGFKTNTITINIDSSSQFLSALLISSVLAPEGLTICTEGSHGMAYILMTMNMMKQFGVECIQESENMFVIKPGQSYGLDRYEVEPDASAAAYFYAFAPLLNIKVCVPGIHFNSLQGDTEFINALCLMGCRAQDTADGIVIEGPVDGVIHGIDIDMSAFSDQAITLAAVAVFADSPTTITGIGHIRLQESNRLLAIITELDRMGIKTESGSDWLRVYPGTPNPCEVHTYDDHRMAMGFSLIGLRAEGITILDPMCCKKTFEDYFDVLRTSSDELTGEKAK